MSLPNLAGQKIGRLTVLRLQTFMQGKSRVWLCQCECGNMKDVRASHLGKNGNIRSCGCLRVDLHKTHGESARGKITRTYKTWSKMLERCNNPNGQDYRDYGGRGINVCARWRKFENFKSDMGEAPIGKSIERKNNSGNYTPANCKWATPLEQGNNKRNNIPITAFGETLNVSQWARRKGIGATTIRWRIAHGWANSDLFNQTFPGGHGAR